MDEELTNLAESNDLVVIGIGNSHVAAGVAGGWRVSDVRSVAASELSELAQVVDELWHRLAVQRPRRIVVASVVPVILEHLRSAASLEQAANMLVVREDIDLPVKTDIDNPETVGTDRVCAAAAAYERTGRACAVADFGTAITIDCVSDDGVFLGGTILPGLGISAASLEEHTAALPLAQISPTSCAFGRNTEQAIRAGIFYGAIGALREIVERFATELGKWPTLVATGRDAQMIADECNFVDAVVPNLVLEGAALAYLRYCKLGVT